MGNLIGIVVQVKVVEGKTGHVMERKEVLVIKGKQVQTMSVTYRSIFWYKRHGRRNSDAFETIHGVKKRARSERGNENV